MIDFTPISNSENTLFEALRGVEKEKARPKADEIREKYITDETLGLSKRRKISIYLFRFQGGYCLVVVLGCLAGGHRTGAGGNQFPVSTQSYQRSIVPHAEPHIRSRGAVPVKPGVDEFELVHEYPR